jgi:rubrerythrin
MLGLNNGWRRSMAHEAGKGSARRQEDVKKIDENWDKIFNKKGNDMELDDDECFDVEHDDDGEWTCDSCGGPMYKQAHWDYGQCDDCGARQELINDDYT